MKHALPTRCARHGLVPLLLCAVVALDGCRREVDEGVLRDVAERENVRLSVTTSPIPLQVGDRLTIEVAFDGPEELDAVMPAADAFDPLTVEPGDAIEPRPGEHGVIRRRIFHCTPLLSGELKIPALRVTYRPQGAEPNSSEDREIATQPLTVAVASSLTREDEPQAPRDISGTLALPEPPQSWWALVSRSAIIGAIAGGVVGPLAAIAYALVRRARRAPPPVPPEIWALRELEALAREDWLTDGGVRARYYRLTEIVRAYVEKKFDLAAPEMTTEEFLGTLMRDQQALPCDADRLRTFLETCDFVKYAAATPGPDDVQAVLSTARAFVHATAAACEEARRAASAASGGQAA
jgi:hypothetical protein